MYIKGNINTFLTNYYLQREYIYLEVLVEHLPFT
jgi:hypothetical protein